MVHGGELQAEDAPAGGALVRLVQVSEEEFTRYQSGNGAGVKEAFACLDPDENGQITRPEMFELRTRCRPERAVPRAGHAPMRAVR